MFSCTGDVLCRARNCRGNCRWYSSTSKPLPSVCHNVPAGNVAAISSTAMGIQPNNINQCRRCMGRSRNCSSGLSCLAKGYPPAAEIINSTPHAGPEIRPTLPNASVAKLKAPIPRDADNTSRNPSGHGESFIIGNSRNRCVIAKPSNIAGRRITPAQAQLKSVERTSVLCDPEIMAITSNVVTPIAGMITQRGVPLVPLAKGFSVRR